VWSLNGIGGERVNILREVWPAGGLWLEPHLSLVQELSSLDDDDDDDDDEIACFSVCWKKLENQFSLLHQNQELLDTHQEMRCPNVSSLYFASILAFNVTDGGGPLGQSP